MSVAGIIALLSAALNVTLAVFAWRQRRAVSIEKLNREREWNDVKNALHRGDLAALRRLFADKPPA